MEARQNVRQRQSLKRRNRRKRQIRMIQRSVLAVCLLGLLLISFQKITRDLDRVFYDNQESIPSYEDDSASGLTQVSAPVRRETTEIYARLKELAASDKTAAKIYESYEEYSENLLAAYLNNPEMEEFVLGYPDADPTAEAGALTAQEQQSDCPLLLQWDSRWGYMSYGESIIGFSGCGPTCLSMVLLARTHDDTYTPAYMADFSEKNGYYVKGSGTSWDLMTNGASQLGLSARELALDESVMRSALDKGELIICTVGPGDFTTEGHFIVIRGYDEEGFLINDPNCRARSSRSWPYDKLRGQIKNLWAYR